jgi:hypothetical protein
MAAGRRPAAGLHGHTQSSLLTVVHILFLTDNFPSEANAPATRPLGHGLFWPAAGYERADSDKFKERIYYGANRPSARLGRLLHFSMSMEPTMHS